jgi:hypothetical protein
MSGNYKKNRFFAGHEAIFTEVDMQTLIIFFTRREMRSQEAGS